MIAIETWMIVTVVVATLATVVGILIGYFSRKKTAERTIVSAEFKAKEIIAEAERDAESTKKEKLLEAKEEALVIKREVEREAKERRNEIQRHERRNQQKEETLDKRAQNLELKEEKLNTKLKVVESKELEVDSLIQKHSEELERIASLTSEEAKNFILSKVEREVEHDVVLMIKDRETKAREEAATMAKEILAIAVQRYAGEFVTESTVSTVTLPNDDMKGRIIGREGRNIRTLETLTGVDVIIDDTPEAVVLSSHDPIRREIARIALERLISDGRIHPARIEDMVEKAKKEVEQLIKTAGEEALFDVGIHSNVHPELLKILGRLKYRTSFGQNVLKHSVEVAHLAGMLASELGADVKIAKRAGLFHDIGKAIDQENEGTHVELGIQILKKYKESQAIITGMCSHHGDYEHGSIEAILVTAADALSAARPGARRENIDAYIKRLEDLENIANSFEGVEKSFAIQAGREVRVIVTPEKVTDDRMFLMAREIAKNIEEQLQYPGNIKVHMLRESRVIEYAK